MVIFDNWFPCHELNQKQVRSIRPLGCHRLASQAVGICFDHIFLAAAQRLLARSCHMNRTGIVLATTQSLLAVAVVCRPGWAQNASRQNDAQVAAGELAITEQALRGHIRFLADDLLEGRGPGSRGDELAQHYIAAQFESLGLKPAAPGGGWFQPVPLVGVTAHVPPTIKLAKAGKSLELKRHDDYVFASGKPLPRITVDSAEIVFVGYGMQAPEFQWDDFKGIDLKGKILLVMNNDPADDPQLFGGKKRLYYGRWDYKYASAARQGAAGAIIIH